MNSPTLIIGMLLPKPSSGGVVTLNKWVRMVKRKVRSLRQRQGRTLTFARPTEAHGVEIAKQVVSRKSVIFADEAGHWDNLHEGWATGRINHSEAYSQDGANTNQVESFFSRLRRMVTGQHHGVSPKYLHQYSAPMPLGLRTIAAARMEPTPTPLWRTPWRTRLAVTGLGIGSGRSERLK